MSKCQINYIHDLTIIYYVMVEKIENIFTIQYSKILHRFTIEMIDYNLITFTITFYTSMYLG